MANNPKSVRDLLNELNNACRGAAERDLIALKELAETSGEEDLKHWDIPYWSERLRENEYNLNDDELRPYFALPRVLSGLFELTERLFDVRIEETTGTVPVWHEDVKFFKIFNTKNEQLAAFYLDPYSRPEEKQGGAWMDTLVGRSSVIVSSGQSVRLPIAYMICNQSKPVGGLSLIHI